MPARRKAALLMWLVLLTCAWLQAFAQTLVQRGAPASETLLIGGGDLLQVAVFDVPELEVHVRVSDAGDVRLPLVGEIRVAGLSAAAASLRIDTALQDGGFVRKPQVTVVVVEFAAADVSISGQVVHPGNYSLRTPRALMDVLTMAGGLTALADVRVTVRRKGAGDRTVYARLPNDPDEALANGVMVEPGDLVIVPRAGIVYVLGDVSRPGGYVMQNDAHLTALQVIALASGTTKTSAESHARLVRQSEGGPIETRIDLKAMQKGEAPDQLLEPQDVLYVPFSSVRNVMLGASAILSSASGAAIYAAH